MRGTRTAVAMMVVFAGVASARASRWIGESSITGPVHRPALYLEAIEPLVCEQFDFDHLIPDTRVDRADLGGFSLHSSPAQNFVIAKAGLVAGTEPGTPPIALLIKADGPPPTTLSFVMSEPVISVGFVLMGLDSPARLKVFGGSESLIGDYVIPAGQAGTRRWIGLSEDDRNIWRVQLEPTGVGEYAIDDVELGVHTPEPVSFLLWALAAMVAMGQVHTNRQRGRG